MAIQVGGSTVITNSGEIKGGNIVADSTNAAPTSGAGFVMNPTSSLGHISIGSSNKYLYFDGNDLKIQGDVSILSDELLQAQTGTFTALTGSATLTGLAAGIYVMVLVGGGAGGCTKNNNRNENNSYKASGGGAGGMCVLAFNYNGTDTLTYTHGGGGAGGSGNASSGGGGGTGKVTLGGTVIAQANGGSSSISNGGNGGTGTSNIANNNALFFAGNNNTAKGKSISNSASSSSGGAGVVIPTMEDADSNLNAACTVNGNSQTSSGGAMSYNFSAGNGTRNTSLAANAASAPPIMGNYTGQPGSGFGVNGTGNASGGAGGIFAGGGGADGYWAASGGAGGIGAGGGGARTSHNDYTPSAGAGGAGRLYYRKL